jgi:hypothetical protein
MGAFMGAAAWACSSATPTGYGDGTSGGSNNSGSTNSNNSSGGNSSNNYGSGSTQQNNNTSNVGNTTSVGNSTTQSGGSTTPTSGGSGCGTPALACSATAATGAVATTSCFHSDGKSAGGYAFYYNDGTSTSCVNSSELCTTGSVGVSSSTIWGAGFGVNVNQVMGGGDAGSPTLSSSGLTWAVAGSAPPGTIQIGITAASGPCKATPSGGGCCFRPTTMSGGTIPWSSFIPACYNGASDAGSFSPSDGLVNVQFQVVAGTTAQTYNYCVTSLSY